ncbi:uncharacterized protein [Physcomitrium patens]|uniref:uncharacterized protein isoform X2 n=1 Tax=Physcomitrium patens TaxID=3218 RepID=UPI003CCDEB26
MWFSCAASRTGSRERARGCIYEFICRRPGLLVNVFHHVASINMHDFMAVTGVTGLELLVPRLKRLSGGLSKQRIKRGTWLLTNKTQVE